MDSQQVRDKFLEFFKSKNHAVIPSAPVVPENDPTVLFTTAGMHPLVPYLMGQPHPLGKRLASVQKCVRTDDIEAVGDMRHFTFFEMLGNWSLGDYFKKEALSWSFDFLTDKKWLGLDQKRIYVTVFKGNKDVPKDEEAIKIWQEIFEKAGVTAKVGDWHSPQLDKGERIFIYGDNWWGPAGQTGPCGPDSEMFYDTGLPHDPKFGKNCHPNCDCGRFLEIWNDVFMQFNKKTDGSFKPLTQQNVDTGMGMERVVAILEYLEKKIDQPDPFKTELFASVLTVLETQSGQKYADDPRNFRIILDHMRAAGFMIADGVEPSNKDRGYILRRLITRALLAEHRLDISNNQPIINELVKIYQQQYPELKAHKNDFAAQVEEEEERLQKIHKRAEKILQSSDKLIVTGEPGEKLIDGRQAFDLEQTYGIKPEILEELLSSQRGETYRLDRKSYAEARRKHQAASRKGSAQRFAGGLQDHSKETTKLHTATHLLHKALREVLGGHVEQAGSNITAERLRFDFTHPQAMTEQEIKQVENLINQKIREDLPVTKTTEDKKTALASGALAFFPEKYPDKVTVYTIGHDPKKDWWSRELCGGPHVTSTSEIGGVTIDKETAVGTGKRRVYAVLKN